VKTTIHRTHITYNSVQRETQITNIPYFKASIEKKIKFGKILTGCKDRYEGCPESNQPF
jgi:hypothetical protein